MIYKKEVSACNPTCTNPDAPEQCNLPDTENCVCVLDTMVVEQGVCVMAETCGCTDSHGARYDVRTPGSRHVCESLVTAKQCSARAKNKVVDP